MDEIGQHTQQRHLCECMRASASMRVLVGVRVRVYMCVQRCARACSGVRAFVRASVCAWVRSCVHGVCACIRASPVLVQVWAESSPFPEQMWQG